MRVRKPWLRASKQAWYVEVDGRQVRLARGGKESEKAAYDAFYKLMANGKPPAPDELLVATLCDLYLDYSERNHASSTFRQYKQFLQNFCRKYPRLTVAELKPFHVMTWIDERPTWKGARRSAIGAIKQAMSWAESGGRIASNPIRHLKKPAVGRRERTVTAAEQRQILAAIRDQEFREYVFALHETGCRPGEVATVTAADFYPELGIWKLDHHKTAKKTGKPRIVYLTQKMVELTQRLVKKYAEGPLFRTKKGKRFTPNAVRSRFRTLRSKLPNLAGIVAYSYRHTFATTALVNGVGLAATAELLGHTNPTMLAKHYSHLAENVAHLRQAAATATASEEPT